MYFIIFEDTRYKIQVPDMRTRYKISLKVNYNIILTLTLTILIDIRYI